MKTALKRFLWVFPVILLMACAALPAMGDRPTAINRPTIPPSPGPTITPAATLPSLIGSPTANNWPTVTPSPEPTITPTATLPFSLWLSSREEAKIQFFPDGGGWLWVYSSNDEIGFWHTTDEGTNWSDVLPAEFSKRGFSPVLFLDSQHTWIRGDGFFLRTIDGGKTWQPLDPKGVPYGGVVGFSDANHGWVVFGGGGAGSIIIQILATQDGGKTWDPVKVQGRYPDQAGASLKLSTICGDDFYYSNRRLMLLYGYNGTCGDSADLHYGVDLSTDFGKTWTTTTFPLPPEADNDKVNIITPMLPIFFDDQNGILPFKAGDFYGTFPAYLAVYHTQDGGRHWLPNPVVLQSRIIGNLQAISATIYTAQCDGGFCITTDSAHSWQKIPFDRGDVKGYSFISPAVAFVLTTEPVPGTDYEQLILWKTLDAGASWSQVPVSALGSS
jgi:photosystem II stability/assembly factor-like uncharacterized protein